MALFLNEKKFERAKKETEEYKYPPIVHIENRLNPSILENNLEEKEDERYGGTESCSKASRLSINSRNTFERSETSKK